MEAGFIGLGNLGKAIALRLLAQKVSLSVWNRTRSKAEALREQAAGEGRPAAKEEQGQRGRGDVLRAVTMGAESHADGVTSAQPSGRVKVTVMTSPAEVAGAARWIILNLFDSTAVEKVLSGEHGLLSRDLSGTVVIDTTTNHPEQVKEFFAKVRKRGGTYLECPVMGSVVPASQGTLTMLVSGDEGAFGEVRPLLEKFCKTIHYLKEPSLATRMKLVNNLVLASFMATLGEALALGERSGLARENLLEILASGAGSSGILNAKSEKLRKGDFTPQFTCAAIAKDLDYIHDLARRTGGRLVVGDAVAKLYRSAVTGEQKEKDFAAVYELFHDR